MLLRTECLTPWILPVNAYQNRLHMAIACNVIFAIQHAIPASESKLTNVQIVILP